MRLRGFHLAGLAAALVGAGAAEQAKAADLTISTATTAPVVTSSANAGAGNVTVASGGSITVTAGQTAITVDTNNAATNAGTLTSTDADDTRGIVLTGGLAGPNIITNSGAINLQESSTLTDTDNDGDLDGLFATGTNRVGILLSGPGAFGGNIVNTGSITIEGQNSAAIRLDALLNGDLTSSGAISVTGDHSTGILIGGAAGGVTGDVNLTGAVNVRGLGSSGLVVNAPIGGALNINGGWSVTGFHSVTTPSSQASLDADDKLIGGPAIAIHANVADGVTIQGIGVEDDTDDDGDGITEAAGDTNDDATASIASYGSSAALLIESTSSNILLGPIASGQGAGFGLNVRGSISSYGVLNGVNSTALLIQGTGGFGVDTSGGVAIDNFVSAGALEADATAIYIGVDATVPVLRMRRSVTSAVNSQTANDSFGVVIGSGANVGTITNTGVLRAQYFGETGNATAIIDHSGSVTAINNSGTIQAQIVPTDDDPTDNIDPPPVTGSTTAINLSASSSNVTITQAPDAVFTDEDAVDDDATSRPAVLIDGDILLGSGNDTINLQAGSITGNIAFGLGADAMTITNGATYAGSIVDSDGALTIDVQNGALSLLGGTTNLTSAHFGANAQLGVLLSSVPADTTLMQASGTVTFDPGAVIIPIVPNGLPNSGSHTFLTAGALVGAANVVGVVDTGVGVPFLYDLSIANVGNTLQANYLLKTPTELGLNRNQTIAFDPVIEAARLDSQVSNALAAIDNQYDFFDAYEDLLPTYSSAVTELAATAIQQSQSATTNRLSATRLNNLNEVSVWAQEIGYGITRTPQDINGQEFRGHGFGLAGGIDGPLDNGALFGLSVSFITSVMEEPGRPQGEISTSLGQANAYLGSALGPVDLDFVGGLGIGKMTERRFVEIGTFSARTDADWWAYEGHGAIRASAPMRLAEWLIVTPQTQLTYVALQEQGYSESGGGAAIDIEADSQFSQRLWADVGVDLGARFHLRGETILSPHIYAGYRANVLDQAAERTFRFESTGTPFTLTDDKLGSGGPLVGIGLDATNGYSTFSIAYEGEFGDQIERHSLNAAIRFRF